jgi:hypothetical protein
MVAIPIIFCAYFFQKAIRDSTMINKGMEIAIERLTADVVWPGNKSALQISLFKYCRDGKGEYFALLYYDS